MDESTASSKDTAKGSGGLLVYMWVAASVHAVSMEEFVLEVVVRSSRSVVLIFGR